MINQVTIEFIKGKEKTAKRFGHSKKLLGRTSRLVIYLSLGLFLILVCHKIL